MLTAGIIGGIGPESTIAYYRHIIAGWRARKDDGSWPPLLINSIDLKRELDLIEDRDGLTTYLADEVARLERAGAGFALFASNTPHIVFDEVQRRVNLPLLSIVDATCSAARQLGLRRLALLGTRFTMESRFYADTFEANGMSIVTPGESERSWIHDRYMNELLANIFRRETKRELLAIITRLIHKWHIDSVILGGTELPLILTDDGDTGVPFLDTTQIHADAVLDRMLQ